MGNIPIDITDDDSKKEYLEENIIVPPLDNPDPEDEYEQIPIVEIIKPTPQFDVLKSLADQGVYFVDMTTGNPIHGFVNSPEIGLSLTPPVEANKDSTLGFIHLYDYKTRLGPKDPDSFEVECVLYFNYEGEECKAGFSTDEGIFVLFVKIWNDNDVPIWEEILNKVVEDLYYEDEGEMYSLIRFVVTSSFIPKSPEHSSKLVLKRLQKDQDITYALSSEVIDDSDDDYYDEDAEKYFSPPIL